ncbi:MAG TPA: peptidylprolyl isomerase [Haliscomenobacter sp.]|nr:peptidylprolyl isomerase [Haliscomenobacter sp.]
MAKNLLLLIGCFFSLLVFSQAQDKDPVLFTVDGTPVHVSEFKYIYSKTNGKNADFSRATLQEYLDLYTKFKLKVKKAKDMRLDTVQVLQEELAGYRRQLADSYLLNKQVTEKLTKELFERSQYDLDISHILFALPAEAKGADTVSTFRQAMEVRARLLKGEDFATIAKQVSADKSAATNGGNIGFVTAMFPNGFYPLESVAYRSSFDQISMPVRTSVGYHLVKVHSKRPARGEVEVAHILLRTEGADAFMVKMQIDTLYAALKKGANFEELAAKSSQDTRTADKGGYVGFVTINRFEQAFEDAAFSVTKDGDYSKPFQTSVGWHIIKRISKKEIQPYDQMRGQLEARIKRDARFEMARKAMVDDIKRETGFKDYPNLLVDFAATLNDTFFTFQWRAPQQKAGNVLFTMAKKAYTLGDFYQFVENATRQRMRMSGETSLDAAVQSLYEEYVNESCLRYEEQRLDQKYPEFKALLREYEEGILLFEATRINVWDKASLDTVGLKNYFKTLKGKYRWEERAVTSVFFVDGTSKSVLEPMREYARKHSTEEILEKFNKSDSVGMRIEEVILEKGKSPEASDLKEWKVGEITIAQLDRQNNEYSFRKVEKILPQQDKLLNEARGYIIADYQDHLEQQWVNELKKQYPIKVEKAVFESLIKK